MASRNGRRETPRLRPAAAADLPAVNRVIERAVMTWNLPDRVKRLSLDSYRYHPHDLAHLALVVAEAPGPGIVGVAAWEPAAPRDLPAGTSGLLLHGLYVDPEYQGQGIGTRLLEAALDTAREHGLDGVLVRAQPGARGFFRSRGMQELPVDDPGRDYPHRYWRPVR